MNNSKKELMLAYLEGGSRDINTLSVNIRSTTDTPETLRASNKKIADHNLKCTQEIELEARFEYDTLKEIYKEKNNEDLGFILFKHCKHNNTPFKLSLND
jgi:hypothetical protein